MATKFITEESLRQQFWNLYSRNKNLVYAQFECPLRPRGVDIVTIEWVKDHFELCAFECKLTDVSKAIAQAGENAKYVHKSFIVVPSDQISNVQQRHKSELAQFSNVGAIAVENGGRYDMFEKARALATNNLQKHQAIDELYRQMATAMHNKILPKY